MSVIWPDPRCLNAMPAERHQRTVLCTRPKGHAGSHTSVNPHFAIPSDVAEAEATLRPVTRWSAS